MKTLFLAILLSSLSAVAQQPREIKIGCFHKGDKTFRIAITATLGEPKYDSDRGGSFDTIVDGKLDWNPDPKNTTPTISGITGEVQINEDTGLTRTFVVNFNERTLRGTIGGGIGENGSLSSIIDFETQLSFSCMQTP